MAAPALASGRAVVLVIAGPGVGWDDHANGAISRAGVARKGIHHLAPPMSKAQLSAFLIEVEGDAALRQRVEAAADANAVAAIALERGHVFSAATLSRHQRG